MTTRTPVLGRTRRRAAPLLAVGLLAVAGCGGGAGGDDAAPSSPASTSGSAGATASDGAVPGTPTLPTPYAEVPAGVTLTPPGTELAVGDPATAAWSIGRDRFGVVDVTVVRVQQTSLARTFRGFELSGAPEDAVPYLVTAEVTNVGTGDLGGRRVPLYARDGEGRLVEGTVVPDTFRACPQGSLPETLAPQASTRTCQVFLVPGDADLAGVSFVPPAPEETITWLRGSEDDGAGPSSTPSTSPSPSATPSDGSTP